MTEERPLTEAELRVLRALTGHDLGLRSGELAAILWPDSPGWRYSKSVSRSGKHIAQPGKGMARPAGAILSRLAKRGLTLRLTSWKYIITDEGREAAKEPT